MPRFARFVVPGVAHHITQRGSARQTVFSTRMDRRVYLGLLREQARLTELPILAYCLMSNHIHLILVPQDGAQLAVMRSTGTAVWRGADIFGRTVSVPARWVRRTCGRRCDTWS
jgi:REP element-mobilizing transposase RayT